MIFRLQDYSPAVECNATITAQYAHGRGERTDIIVAPRRLGHCSQKYVQEHLLAEQIKLQLKAVAINDGWFEQGSAQIDKWEEELKNNSASFIQDLESEIKEAELRLNKLVDSYLDNLIEKGIYLEKKKN